MKGEDFVGVSSTVAHDAFAILVLTINDKNNKK
jgi:hypothetical protein